MPGCIANTTKPAKMFIDRIFVSTRMSSLVFPRLQRERKRRADAEQEAEKWRQRAEQLQVQDEAQARSVLDDARVDFGKAEDQRRQAAADREAAEEERRGAAYTMKKAEDLLARVRRAGQWAVDRAAKLNAIEDALVARERAVREEEETHELKRLGIYPTTPLTDADVATARRDAGIVDNAVNVCVLGAPRSGKSSLINALRGVDAADVYAAPVLGPRSSEYGRPTVYYDARTPGLVYHEVPEGRNTDLSGWAYYVSRRLYAYDVVLLINSDSPSELETRVAQIAHRRGQPCLQVRTKADEHIRNTRRISKYALVDDARGAYKARVHSEAAQRREAASTLETLRPPRDSEFVVSEMGLYSLVTGEDHDPEEVYGTGEEDETRLLEVVRGLVRPRVAAREEELEDVLGEVGPEFDEGADALPAPGEPSVEEVIAQVEAALRISEGHQATELAATEAAPAPRPAHVDDEDDDDEPDSQPTSSRETELAETPFETPFEFAPTGHLTPNAAAAVAAKGGSKQPSIADGVSVADSHEDATQVPTQIDESKLGEVRYDEPIGACGERV